MLGLRSFRGLGSFGLGYMVYGLGAVLKGSWNLVSKVITKVAILITPIRGLITLLTKSHDALSRTLNPKP